MVGPVLNILNSPNGHSNYAARKPTNNIVLGYLNQKAQCSINALSIIMSSKYFIHKVKL